MARSLLIPNLPRFIPPMLATSGAPFDSPEHLFEIKWNGTRVLAFVDQNGYRLVNRNRAKVTDRYPELGFLATLPAGPQNRRLDQGQAERSKKATFMKCLKSRGFRKPSVNQCVLVRIPRGDLGFGFEIRAN